MRRKPAVAAASSWIASRALPHRDRQSISDANHGAPAYRECPADAFGDCSSNSREMAKEAPQDCDDMFLMMARLPRVLVPPIGGGYATDPGKCREPPGALVRDGKDDAPPRASRSSELAPSRTLVAQP
jgi:hypothetical protein